MGDNRNHSSDSRLAELGAIDERYIIGQAVLRLLPLQTIAVLS
jgi:signal peptidase I